MALVEFDQVSKDYWLGSVLVSALRGVSFSIESGEFVSITGPSGSGKSTILNLIGLVDSPSNGTIRLDGKAIEDLRDWNLTELRHQALGFIFQSFNLIPVLNVRENIELPLLLGGSRKPSVEDRDFVNYLIAEVGLYKHTQHRPHELSGGQRQRVAIARALVNNPLMVLADEPTANLDSDTGESILALMKRIHDDHGTTFVFSTHDPRIVERADHVIRLRDGQVIQDEHRQGQPA